jgi:hypothetical protein
MKCGAFTAIKSIKSGCGGLYHGTGETIAFWFGTGEHGNLDKLLALLKPLDIGNVYTDGNCAYYERAGIICRKRRRNLDRTGLLNDILAGAYNIQGLSRERCFLDKGSADRTDCAIKGDTDYDEHDKSNLRSFA